MGTLPRLGSAVKSPVASLESSTAWKYGARWYTINQNGKTDIGYAHRLFLPQRRVETMSASKTSRGFTAVRCSVMPTLPYGTKIAKSHTLTLKIASCETYSLNMERPRKVSYASSTLFLQAQLAALYMYGSIRARQRLLPPTRYPRQPGLAEAVILFLSGPMRS